MNNKSEDKRRKRKRLKKNCCPIRLQLATRKKAGQMSLHENWMRTFVLRIAFRGISRSCAGLFMCDNYISAYVAAIILDCSKLPNHGWSLCSNHILTLRLYSHCSSTTMFKILSKSHQSSAKTRVIVAITQKNWILSPKTNNLFLSAGESITVLI